MKSGPRRCGRGESTGKGRAVIGLFLITRFCCAQLLWWNGCHNTYQQLRRNPLRVGNPRPVAVCGRAQSGEWGPTVALILQWLLHSLYFLVLSIKLLQYVRLATIFSRLQLSVINQTSSEILRLLYSSSLASLFYKHLEEIWIFPGIIA